MVSSRCCFPKSRGGVFAWDSEFNESWNLIVPGDRELQHGRDGDPDQIWDLRDGDPTVVGPDDFHRPEDGDPDNRDIDGGEREVSQAELDWREDDIGDQVDGKRDRYWPSDLLARGSIEDVSEREQNDRIEDLPDRANRRRLGRPSRFVEGVVPISPSHAEQFEE